MNDRHQWIPESKETHSIQLKMRSQAIMDNIQYRAEPYMANQYVAEKSKADISHFDAE